MLEKITEALRTYKNDPTLEITEKTTFESLKLDSLDMADLIMNIEDELGKELEPDESIKTVGDLVKALEA